MSVYVLRLTSFPRKRASSDREEPVSPCRPVAAMFHRKKRGPKKERGSRGGGRRRRRRRVTKIAGSKIESGVKFPAPGGLLYRRCLYIIQGNAVRTWTCTTGFRAAVRNVRINTQFAKIHTRMRIAEAPSLLASDSLPRPDRTWERRLGGGRTAREVDE